MILVQLFQQGGKIAALMGRDQTEGMGATGETPAEALRALADVMERRGGNDFAKYPKNESLFLDCIAKPASGCSNNLNVIVRQPMKASVYDLIDLMNATNPPSCFGSIAFRNNEEVVEGALFMVLGKEEFEELEAVIKPIREKWNRKHAPTIIRPPSQG